MIEDVKTLTKHTLTYGFGGIVNGLVRLAFIPIVSRYLAPDAFGVYSLLLMTVSFLFVIFDMGLSYALMKRYNELEGSEAQTKAVGTAFASIAVIGTAICGVALFFSVPLSRFLFRTGAHTTLVRIAVVIALLGSIFQLLLSLLRASAKSRSFVLFTSVRGLSNVILTFAFVISLSMGIEGFLWGTLLSFLLGIGAFFILFTPRLVFSFEFAKSMLGFGLPLMPSNLAVWVLTYADIYLLKTLAGLREVGLYQFAQEICAVVSLFLVSFERAWPQFVFSRYERESARGLFRRVFTTFFAALALIGLTLALFRSELLSLLSAVAYFDATSVIPLLISSGILYWTYYVFGTGLLVKGKTSFFPLITVSGALMNILLNLALIPPYGIVGAGVATVLTNIVMAAGVLLLSNRYYAIPFDLWRILVIGCVGLLLYATAHIFQASFPTPLFMKVIFVVGFGIFLYIFVFSHAASGLMENESTPKDFRKG